MNISVYVDKRRPRKDGSFGVYLRFKGRGCPPYLIHTGVSCRYAPVGMVFPSTEPNGVAKGIRVMDLYSKCVEFDYRNSDVSDARKRAAFEEIVTGRKSGDGGSVECCFRDYVETKGMSYGRMFERTCGKVLSFDPDVDFDSVDKRWLERFARWLESGGANVNGIAHHMRNLRAVFNFAIDDGLTQNYPFRKYKIRREQTRKRDLTATQLRELHDYPCEPFQQKYVDLFFLMFYLCGINAGDLFLLKEANINNDRIEYYRQKTKKYYSIKIEPEAAHIINKYRGKDWLLDVMDTNVSYSQPLKRMNQQLKKVGMDYHEGGKWTGDALFPDLSSYYARHSWASIAAEVDVPMDVIAQALGHSTPYMTTDIYVNRRLRKIDEANRRVIDYFKSGE